MKNNSATLFPVSVISFLLLFIPFSIALADHSWNNYHWARTTSPFILQVIDSVSTDWQSEFDTALSQWSLSDKLNLQVGSANDSNRIRKRCPMAKGQIRVCNNSYGFNGWLGLATIGLDSNGHIDRGSAKMNESYASYWSIEGEKNHVVCQEVGHLFGLGHTSEDGTSQGTCMDYSSDINSQWPNAHDYEQLLAQYGHLDSYDSYDGGSTDGGGSSGCKAPPGKGCNAKVAEIPPMGIRVVKGKRHEIWVASRVDGGLWIHHVRLAP